MTEEKPENKKYESIINMKRPEPDFYHPRMPVSSRAAQFAPFAALTGYEDEIEEESRETETKKDLSDDSNEENERLLKLIRNGKLIGKMITVTWYLPDPSKPGGSYRTETVKNPRVDSAEGKLYLGSGPVIPLENILTISCENMCEEAFGDY